MDDLARIRGWYAEDLRLRTPIRRNMSVAEAFAAVPRERFLGPGPWHILPDNRLDQPFVTPDDAPHWLYHDVLVAIDPARRLNNGMPSFWAHNLDHLDLQRGERVLQVGAGTGYYSALLGRNRRAARPCHGGRVRRSPRRAGAPQSRAAGAQVEVVAGDGRTHDPGEVDAVVVFAGLDPPCPALARPAGRGRPADDAADRGELVGLRAARDAARRRIRRRRDRLGRDLPLRGRTRRGGGAAAAAKRCSGAPPRIRVGTAVPDAASGRSARTEADVWYHAPGFWLLRAQAARSARTRQP